MSSDTSDWPHEQPFKRSREAAGHSTASTKLGIETPEVPGWDEYTELVSMLTDEVLGLKWMSERFSQGLAIQVVDLLVNDAEVRTLLESLLRATAVPRDSGMTAATSSATASAHNRIVSEWEMEYVDRLITEVSIAITLNRNGHIPAWSVLEEALGDAAQALREGQVG